MPAPRLSLICWGDNVIGAERSAEIIRRMKGIPGGSGMRFPIRDEGLNVIGYLRGFDKSRLGDGALIETMARAHTQNKENFMTQFDVTPANKRYWLENSVLANDKKMLFLVETQNGRVVGQDGFTIREDGVFVSDASMKWERDGHPALFLRNFYERAAMCFVLLGCVGAEITFFKKNIATMLNVKRLGARKTGEYPLVKSAENGKIIYAKADDPSQINTGEILIEYHMQKDDFLASHKNLVEHPCWEAYSWD